MSKDELIVKQQLQIEELSQALKDNKQIKRDLRGQFIAMGQPLNDNLLGFNKEQLWWCFQTFDLIDNIKTI